MPEDMTYEELRVTIVLDAQQAIAEAQRFRQLVNQAKIDIVNISAQSRTSFGDTATALKRLADEGIKVKAITQAMKEMNQATKEVNQTAQQSVGTFGNFGSILNFVFGTVLGITAVTALRKLIDVLKEAVTDMLEFTQAVFNLEVGVRALQRIGMDTTLEKWRTQIKELRSEFSMFSTKEITQGVSVSLLKLREFGFTEQQIQNTQRMAATLSLLTGKEFQESVQGVTYALGSGYFEALQRAGVQISRTIVAQEALRRGFEGAYQSLDDNVRAMLTYDIIMRQIIPLEEDAKRFQETTPGRLKALTAAWEDFSLKLGTYANPALGEMYRMLSLLIPQFERVLKGFTLLTVGILTNTAVIIRAILNLNRVLTGELTFEEFGKKVQEFYQKQLIYYSQLFDLIGQGQTYLGNAPIGQAPMEEVTPEAQAMVALDDVLDEYRKFANDMRDLDTDLQRDLEKIDRDAAYKRLEVWQDFADEIKEITEDMYDKLAEEELDYAQKVARINEDANQRRAEAEARYRNNEITAEARFQERLRQLRENFLLSLEDAVRERDARQVIQLTKQYNLQKEQMKREEQLRKDEARREFELQLKFMEAERQQRLRYAQIEHEERMREIREQAEDEKAEAVHKREEELAGIAAAEARAEEERKIRYAQQVEDLKTHFKDRLTVLAEKLQEEYDITMGFAKSIYDGLYSYYGPGGAMEELYKYFFQMLTNMAKAAAGLWGPGAGLPYGPPNTSAAPGNAEGGTWLLTKPTTLMAGEAGPELATFIPLTRGGVNVGQMRGGGQMPAGLGGGLGAAGNMQVKIALSPGLEAEITENTLNEAASMIMRIERERE